MAWDESIDKETREAVYLAVLASSFDFLLTAANEYSEQVYGEKITIAEGEIFPHDALVKFVFQMIQNTNICCDGCHWIDPNGRHHLKIQ